MEFAAAVSELLAGRVWNWTISSHARLSLATIDPLGVRPAAYLIAALVIGIAIGELEVHALLSSS